MTRRSILIACLVSTVIIGAALSLANAQTGAASSSQGSRIAGQTSNYGSSGPTGAAGTHTGATGTHTDATGVHASATATGTLHVGDPYDGPAIVISGTPDIVAVPGTKVYYINNSDYDMYRVGSDWYYRYDGKWYRGTNYNGPYAYVTATAVPRSVRTVPVKYRHHWSTTTSTTETSMSTGGAGGTPSARVHSSRKTRTAGYSKATRTKRAHSKARSASTLGKADSYEDSHESAAGGMTSMDHSSGSMSSGGTTTITTT